MHSYLQFLILLSILQLFHGHKATSAPRFKTKPRLNHYNYLGDNVKFTCTAIGKPAPKVHWYRNGDYLNYSYMHQMHRYKENEPMMSLEIKSIELGDKGDWMCRVWNNEGSITRNFKLHIIDYCDFFLNANYTAGELPLECVCQWKMLKFTRDEVDFEEVSDEICKQFYRDNENTIMHRRSSCIGRPCTPSFFFVKRGGVFKQPFNPNNTLLYKHVKQLAQGMSPKDVLSNVTSESLSESNGGVVNKSITVLDINAKVSEMRAIMKRRPSVVHNSSEDADKTTKSINNVEVEIDGEKVNLEEISIKQTTESPENTDDYDEEQDHIETTTRAGYWPGPQRLTNLAPYFRQANLHDTEPVVSPAGRTIKLSCRASGMPIPQITWRKKDQELTEDSERNTGSPYRFRKFSLEMQDAVESDSGQYSCEVFNKHGTIRRNFDVRVVDRSRSKPLVVPNVLINQTVDVNSTVNFTCKVMSEALPYFTWAKLLLINGSYINNSNPNEPKFNLLDAFYIPRSKMYRDNRITVLSIENVQLSDQGVYACISGNSLGLTMANASLTVNEFRPMTLPTEKIAPPTNFQTILFAALLLLAVILGILSYIFYQRIQSKNRIQNMGVLKKVIITKREPKEGEMFPDLASSYAITIESVVRKKEMENSLDANYEVPTDPEWEIDRSRLTLVNKIGEGAFGEVWKAMYRQEKTNARGIKEEEIIPVAVKKLKNDALSSDQHLIVLVSEMQIFKSLEQGHENVLRLIGCCTGMGPLFVVLELCPYENLKNFLRSHRSGNMQRYHDSFTDDQSLSYVQPRNTIYEEIPEKLPILEVKLMLRDLVRFAMEIARGMEFLASKKIIHRDLAARNVLVSENYKMKISDFGLSRNVIHRDYYRKHTNGNLPVKWMAPESLDDTRQIYTTFSDVWSYGIIVWEIFSLGEQPYQNIQMGQLYEKLIDGYRMAAPPKCPEEIYSVMTMCWRSVPEDRPLFKVIADYFEAIMQTTSAENYDDNYSEISHSSNSENENEGELKEGTEEQKQQQIIYDTPRVTQLRLAHGLMPFEDFVSAAKHSAEFTRDETPSLVEEVHTRPNSSRARKKRRPHSEHVYCNVKNSDATTPLWNYQAETEPESDAANTSEASHQNSREKIFSTQDLTAESNYVNDPQFVPKTRQYIQNKPKPTAVNRQNSGCRSDSSTIDLGVIYSSPPSKKSSSSNLSVSVNPVANPSRSSSRNGFIQRSYSTESQTSSGRGGSSAMSSAEGLGGLGDICQIEYTTINPTTPLLPPVDTSMHPSSSKKSISSRSNQATK